MKIITLKNGGMDYNRRDMFVLILFDGRLFAFNLVPHWSSGRKKECRA